MPGARRDRPSEARDQADREPRPDLGFRDQCGMRDAAKDGHVEAGGIGGDRRRPAGCSRAAPAPPQPGDPAAAAIALPAARSAQYANTRSVSRRMKASAVGPVAGPS
jgi:hypothetical protein